MRGVAHFRWRYEPLYTSGWSVDQVFDAAVVDRDGEEIGDVENIVFNRKDEVLSLIAGGRPVGVGTHMSASPGTIWSSRRPTMPIAANTSAHKRPEPIGSRISYPSIQHLERAQRISELAV